MKDVVMGELGIKRRYVDATFARIGAVDASRRGMKNRGRGFAKKRVDGYVEEKRPVIGIDEGVEEAEATFEVSVRESWTSVDGVNAATSLPGGGGWEVRVAVGHQVCKL